MLENKENIGKNGGYWEEEGRRLEIKGNNLGKKNKNQEKGNMRLFSNKS